MGDCCRVYLFIYLLLCFSFYFFFLSCVVVVLCARDCSCGYISFFTLKLQLYLFIYYCVSLSISFFSLLAWWCSMHVIVHVDIYSFFALFLIIKLQLYLLLLLYIIFVPLHKSRTSRPVDLMVFQRSIAITEPLTKLFNLSILSGIFPSEWKWSNIVPISKNKK